ncbi:MAG: EscU/YscU/HrcU family type III secretion system export apparatus switch protein [Phycisphaerales bacterium]
MSESSGEKTEAPTPQRLKKAREQGQVAQSRDLTAAIALFVGTGLLWANSRDLEKAAETAAMDCFRAATATELEVARVMSVAGTAAFGLLAVAVVPLVVAAATAVLVSFLQVGPLVSVEALTPKLERLDPIGGLKQRFASMRAYVELGKNLLKYVIGIPVFYVLFKGRLPDIAMLATRDPFTSAAWTAAFLSRLTFSLLACYLALGMVDLLYQRWQLMKDLRMTMQEVKDSYKQEEGDPHHKAKRKQLHEEINSAQMLMAVPEADVVITNPDHYAVALRWDPDKEGAPRIIAKGADHMAQRIKEIAKQNGIPIDRRASLARTLHSLQLNVEIPPDLYAAVIAVLEWAEEESALVGRTPNWLRKQQGAEEEPPEEAS